MESLDFKKLCDVVFKKRFEFIIIMLTSLIIGLIFTFFVNKPLYKSYTTLILGRVDNVVSIDFDKKEIVQSEILLTSNLVDTYEQVIKSRSFSQEVITKLGSKITSEEFIESVNIRNIYNTEVLEISVTNENPDLACSIANATALVFEEKVKEIHGIDKVSIIDTAIPAEEPYNIHHIEDVIIATFIGFVMASGFVYVYYLIYEKPFIENEERVKEINRQEIKIKDSINNNIVQQTAIEKQIEEEIEIKPKSQILEVMESKKIDGEMEMPRNTVNVIEEKYVLEKDEVYDAEVNEKGIIVYPGKAIKRMFKLIKDMVLSTIRGLKIFWKRIRLITLKLVKIIKHNYKVYKEKSGIKKVEKEKILEQKRIEKEKELEQKRIEREKILEEKKIELQKLQEERKIKEEELKKQKEKEEKEKQELKKREEEKKEEEKKKKEEERKKKEEEKRRQEEEKEKELKRQQEIKEAERKAQEQFDKLQKEKQAEEEKRNSELVKQAQEELKKKIEEELKDKIEEEVKKKLEENKEKEAANVENNKKEVEIEDEVEEDDEEAEKEEEEDNLENLFRFDVKEQLNLNTKSKKKNKKKKKKNR